MARTGNHAPTGRQLYFMGIDSPPILSLAEGYRRIVQLACAVRIDHASIYVNIVCQDSPNQDNQEASSSFLEYTPLASTSANTSSALFNAYDHRLLYLPIPVLCQPSISSAFGANILAMSSLRLTVYTPIPRRSLQQ